MELSHAKIVFKSKINLNCYYLFNDKIIVDKNDGDYIQIYFPKKSGLICFYDMYYAADGLRIIIATRNDYDLVAILDEDNLTINIINYTK